MTRCQIEFYEEPEPRDGELGEPAARIYQHADGYPDTNKGVLHRLKMLERRLAGKDLSLRNQKHPDTKRTVFDYAKIFGTRTHDPEWAAAEYISMFRVPMCGNIYVSQHLHGDLDYLYRVVCSEKHLTVHVFKAAYTNDLQTFEEVTQ